MRLRTLLIVVLCLTGFSSLYSQTIVGRMNVDQYPIAASGQLTYGLTWLPDDYKTSTDKYALIIFLHGSGECGDGVAGLSKLIGTGMPMHIANGWNPVAKNPVDGKTYKFIVVCPQAPASSQWSYSYQHVKYILPYVMSKYRIDPSRVYLTGLSAGGAGTWSSVCNSDAFTQQITAILPINAVGLNNAPVEAPHMQDVGGKNGVRVWAICGALDGHYTHNQTDVNTINNGNPKPAQPAVLTLLPGVGHEAASWNKAYDPNWRGDVNPWGLSIYEWMIQYSRANAGTNPSQPANLAPVANAGADLNITLPTSSVSLDGSASKDDDGSVSSYKWIQVSGPNNASFGSAASAKTTATGLAAGTYVFQITVTDNKGATASDQITVVVKAAANLAPTAAAGSDQTITLPTSSVNLDGSASKDADGSISSYAWTRTSGPASASFSAASASKTTVSGLTEGTYVFTLTVKDNSGVTASDAITVIVKPAPVVNKAPTANAGGGQTITLPTSSVNLDGSGSSDPDGSISSYAWTRTSGPASATFSAASASKTTVSGLTEGTYVFTLTVKDNSGVSASSQVTVVVKAAPVVNQAPTANAGADQSITLPTSSVNLDGSASKDPDGTLTYWLWTKVSGPNNPTFSAASGAKTTVSGLAAGTYVFSLTVKDNNSTSASDQVTITVAPAKPANQAPVANAGADQTVTLPANEVTLNAKGSSDAETPYASLAMQWTVVSGPSGYWLTNPVNTITNINKLVAGTYVVSLKVTDAGGLSSTDNVTITVKTAAPVVTNKPPVADAGADQTITLPASSVTLSGAGSSDDNTALANLTMKWITISGPTGSWMSNSVSSTTTLNSLLAGTYLVTLKVTDASGAYDMDTVKITVKTPSSTAIVTNKPPVANAGADQTIVLPDNQVTLNAKGSSDAETSYASLLMQWSVISGPSGYWLTNPPNTITNVNKLVAGTYVVTLKVTDAGGASDMDTVLITVRPAGSSAATTASVDENMMRTSLDDDIAIYPNPVQTTANVVFSGTYQGKSEIWIYNSNGAVVYHRSLVKASTSQQEYIDLSKLPAGVYFLTASTYMDRKPIRKMIVKQ